MNVYAYRLNLHSEGLILKSGFLICIMQINTKHTIKKLLIWVFGGEGIIVGPTEIYCNYMNRDVLFRGTGVF